ncbi:MAG: hypothetical protein O2925_09650 [Actinomycetota bacterium]|nr:hypothetical protein [Actinomycetota bacterium]MDA3029049.1 hypothetical protein [Actinomycetota bacterium]
MSAAVPMMSLAEVRAATAASSTDLATTTITPVRIVDTRPGAGALGGAKVPWQAMETRTVEAAGLGSIPADAVGVVVNVTALNATTSDTFLTLFPTGSVMPNASTLNPPLGQVAFNAATVLLGPDGAFEVYNYSGTVDVIVDVTAYMTRTLAESVEVVESDVGRLSSGQPLLSLRDAGSNSFFFDALGYSDWTNYRLSDQSGLFGAPIEIGRYSEAATVELRVAARIPESDEFELCFAIHSTLDGLISESEVCVDSNSEEAADGIALVASQRVPIPVEGFMSPYVKVKPRDGATCPKNPDNQYSLCVGYMEWFGFYVYD